MAKTTITKKRESLLQRRRRAMREKLKKAAGGKQDRVAIVDLQEGGFGWRVLNDKGTPLNLRFGRVYAAAAPDEAEKYELSSKVIDEVLGQANAARLVRAAGGPHKQRTRIATKAQAVRVGRSGGAGALPLSDRD
jgi:hypothetical protein